MTHVIEALQAERTALRGRLMKIEAAIEEYERWAQSVVQLVSPEVTQLVSRSNTEAASVQTPISSFEDAVRALLKDATAPLKRVDIHDALVDGGVVIGGKEPLNTVASRLSRMKGITNLKGFGYWAEDRAYAPAGYTGSPSPAEEPASEGAADPQALGLMSSPAAVSEGQA